MIAFLENLTASAAWPFILALLGPAVAIADAKFGLNLTATQIATALSTIIAAIAHSAVTQSATTKAAAGDAAVAAASTANAVTAAAAAK